MAYISLYRKYRSQSFDDLSGQEHVTRTLSNALRAGRVGHAYLFCGPRGTGKTSVARLLAKCLNCAQAPTLEPCNQCPSCVEINAGITGASFNVQEFDAASKRSIDDIRHLRDTIGTGRWGPGEEEKGRKVVIIDEVHMLTTEAFNALLKTLEEPPAHVLFVLATTDVHKVPATIVSRCQRFDFHRGSLDQIGARLRFVAEAEGVSIEDAAIERIARGSGGSWRDALSLLEQVLAYGGERVTAADVTTVLGTVAEEDLAELARVVAAGDGAGVFAHVDRLVSGGKDIRQLARDLTEYFRQLLQVAVGAVPQGGAPAEHASLARSFGVGRLVAGLELLAATEREFKESDQLRLILEVALVRLAHLDGAAAAVTAAAAAVPAEPGPPATGMPAVSTTNGRGAGPGRAPQPASPPAEAGPPAVTVPSSRPAPEPAVERVPAGRGDGDGQAPGESGGAVDLDTLKRRWGVLIEELRRRKQNTTAALVSDAQPLRVDGATLVLRFEFDTHAQLVQGAKHRKPLEEAVAAVFGTRLSVTGEAGGAPAPGDAPVPVPAPPRPPEAGRPAPKEGDGGAAADNSRLVHDVIELFDGKIIDEDPT